MFEKYLERWQLTPDGGPVITRGSRLLPVRVAGVPAMLKIALDIEEKFGGVLMSWWDGQGAARVFAHEDDALLMERAEGLSSLLDMALNGRDDEASRIICDVVAQLHTPRLRPPPALVPLAQWFQALPLAAVAEAAGLERERLLQWIVAYAGLSAAWFLEDGDAESAKGDLAVAELALMELGKLGR